ncbi:hypothetical protein SBDP1_1310042 [Syntrophobacter sp. SbD1]|nr:hypothetical protein SBDP1_1310042 [Syntrophobacter sp. SbD1]
MKDIFTTAFHVPLGHPESLEKNRRMGGAKAQPISLFRSRGTEGAEKSFAGQDLQSLPRTRSGD